MTRTGVLGVQYRPAEHDNDADVPSLSTVLAVRSSDIGPACHESREPCVTQHRALCDHCALCMCIVVHCAPRPSSQAHQRVYQYSLFQETSVLVTALLSVSTAWITESGIFALGGIYRSFILWDTRVLIRYLAMKGL